MAQRSLHLLFLGTAIAALAGCGGGGGGGGSDVDPTPAEPGSGLEPATAIIRQTENTARQLASRVSWVYDHAANGAAAVALGRATPVPGEDSVQCDGGNGEVNYAGSGPSFTATYDQCRIGDYTFDGTATVTIDEQNGELDSYEIDFTNSTVSVTGPNAFAADLEGGTVECEEASAGVYRCVASYQLVNWGNDFEFDYTNLTADGSTGCLCGDNNRVNVKVTTLGASSGAAEVTGRNDGSAVVTRSGPAAFQVELDAEGDVLVYPFTDIVASSSSNG